MESKKMHVSSRGYLVHEELIKVIEGRGGFFILDSSDNFVERVNLSFAMMIGFIQQDPRINIYRVIYAEIIQSEKVNAFCYASPDEEYPYDFIGVEYGAIASALEVCNRLMSLPTFLPHIGNVDAENTERVFCDYWHESSLYSGRSNCEPRDSMRASFAVELALMIVEFLFFHEATHLGNGHMEYLAKINKVSYMMEEQSSIKAKTPPIIRQTLEMDADAGAVLKLMFYCEQKRKALDMLGVGGSAVFELLGDNKSIAASVVLASSLAFRLFHRQFYNEGWNPYMQEMLPWPAVPMREHLKNLTILNILEVHQLVFGLGSSEVVELLYTVGRDIESAMSVIEQREPSGTWYSPIVSPHATKYIDELSAAWSEMRPSLVPNVRRGNLAAAKKL